MDLLLHRGIFGGHAEGVPPHRVQHLVARHPLVACEHVAHRIVADMAHVDAPRRIGKHLEHIGLGLGRSVVGAKRLRRVPGLLPTAVGGERVEAAIRFHRQYIDPWGDQPVTAPRRRSRARSRMMSSSFWTVCAATGASIHWPFWLTSREAATRIASARRSWSRIVIGQLHPLARRRGIGIPVGDDHAAVRIRLDQRHERHRIERGAPQIGVDADLRDLGGGEVGIDLRLLVMGAACEQDGGGEGAGEQTREAGRKQHHQVPSDAGNGASIEARPPPASTERRHGDGMRARMLWIPCNSAINSVTDPILPMDAAFPPC